MCMFCLIVHSRATLLCGSHSPRSKVQSGAIRLPIRPHGACPHTHHAERHSFVFLKFSGMITQNLTARTTAIVRFGTSFGEIFHWRNLPGEICWRNLSGEICRRNLLANLPAKFAGEICSGICRQIFRRIKFGKDKPDSRRKTTPKNFTCKLHRSQNVPSTHPKNPACFLRGWPEGAAQVKGLSVFKLCRLQQQASGTKRGTKVGVLCYFCSHVSLVGLSLRNCTRWPLGLRPSDSRLQKEYSVVARVSKREGRYGFNDFGGARNQVENRLPMDIRGGKFNDNKNILDKKCHLTVLQATPEQL